MIKLHLKKFTFNIIILYDIKIVLNSEHVNSISITKLKKYYFKFYYVYFL